jgi:alkylation response protein AidB-like acyl-CoA dehydrogenase
MFTEEQGILRQMVRKLARDRIAPRAAQIDETGEYPWDILELYKREGLLGVFFPEEYGGTVKNMTSACIIGEEVAKVCLNSAYILATHALGSLTLLLGGNEAQKERILPRLATGDWLCATAMTEPNAGSDMGSIETRAVPVGSHYVLNGTKIFCSNADVSDIIFIFATTDPAKKHKGISIFAVEKGTPGLVIGRKEVKLGTRANSTCQLILEDCRVHKENLVGPEGHGFITGMRTLEQVRPFAAATAVGLAQGALDYSVRYAKERVQFGKPIAAFQGLQFMMADMAMMIEAARQLTYRAARMVDRNDREVSVAGAMAKAYAADVAMKVTVDALQILGGHGYTQEHPLERMMRDAKLFAIGEGTTQIQKLIIARELVNR